MTGRWKRKGVMNGGGNAGNKGWGLKTRNENEKGRRGRIEENAGGRRRRKKRKRKEGRRGTAEGGGKGRVKLQSTRHTKHSSGH